MFLVSSDDISLGLCKVEFFKLLIFVHDVLVSSDVKDSSFLYRIIFETDIQRARFRLCIVAVVTSL